jgi:hypothetical protein
MQSARIPLHYDRSKRLLQLGPIKIKASSGNVGVFRAQLLAFQQGIWVPRSSRLRLTRIPSESCSIGRRNCVRGYRSPTRTREAGVWHELIVR